MNYQETQGHHVLLKSAKVACWEIDVSLGSDGAEQVQRLDWIGVWEVSGNH